MDDLNPPTIEELFKLTNGLIKVLGKRKVMQALIRQLDESDDIEMMATSLPLFLWIAGKRKEAEQIMLLLRKQKKSQRSKVHRRKGSSVKRPQAEKEDDLSSEHSAKELLVFNVG